MKTKAKPQAPAGPSWWLCPECRRSVPVHGGFYDIADHLMDEHRDVWLNSASVKRTGAGA